MKMIKIICLIGLILMISGCAGTAKVNETPSTQTASVDGSQKTSADNSNTKVSVSAPKKDLKDIVSLTPRYTADYDITAGGQDMKLTMVYALPKFATITKTPQGDAKVIFDGTTVISCTNADNAWQCFKMTIDTPSNIETEDLIKSDAAKTVNIGSCAHAGLSGSNYEVEANGEKSMVCYTDDGILLEAKTPESSMVATRISKTVSESDFTPPVEPQDLSAMIPKGIPGYS